MAQYQLLAGMTNANYTPPSPQNEPVLSYEPGSPEKIVVKSSLEEMLNRQTEVAIRVGDEAITTVVARTTDDEHVPCRVFLRDRRCNAEAR